MHTDPEAFTYMYIVLFYLKGCVREQPFQLMPHIYRWLTHPGAEEELCIAALSCLHVVSNNNKAMEWLSDGKNMRERNKYLEKKRIEKERNDFGKLR